MKKSKELKKLKETSKGRALLKLIHWSIFFALILVICLFSSIISNNSQKTSPKTEETTPKEVIPEDILQPDIFITTINNLNSNSYNYNYEIVINNIKYIYNGTKTPTTDIGYKESPNGTIKYYIDSTGTYSETTSGRTLITDLYAEINPDYLDFNYIRELIPTLEFKLNNNYTNNYLYEALKDDINYQIELEKNTYNLKYIKITNPTFNYNLTFN